MVADVTKRNEETKKKGTTMGRRSTTNAAQERRKVMFNKADESESAKFAKGNMFMNGEGGLWKVTTEELGTMGVGIQLYFQISKILSVAFLVMTLCHVPTMWLNSSGNGGYALSADLKSSFASLSLANQGFSWATVQEPDCIVNGGDADCSGLTVDIHGTRWDAHEVSATILACEMAAAIVFIITCGLCVIVVQKMDAQVDDENAEPEDYAVFVRNLPKDVTIQDLIDHFSDKYALDKETQVRSDEERRLERSDSKSSILPSYITNNLPPVALLFVSLIAALSCKVESRRARDQEGKQILLVVAPLRVPSCHVACRRHHGGRQNRSYCRIVVGTDYCGRLNLDDGVEKRLHARV